MTEILEILKNGQDLSFEQSKTIEATIEYEWQNEEWKIFNMSSKYGATISYQF